VNGDTGRKCDLEDDASAGPGIGIAAFLVVIKVCGQSRIVQSAKGDIADHPRIDYHERSMWVMTKGVKR
jgi:hypothetical protein